METNDIFIISNGYLSGIKGSNIIESVTIPDGVTVICTGAFHDYSTLVKIFIPKSVIKIGGGAFCYCNNLQSVVFLDNDKRTKALEICNGAFEGCTSLRSINLPENVYLGRDVFKDCTSLGVYNVFGMDGKTIKHYSPNSQATEYRIPDEVISIEKHSFKDCTSLQSIIIPEGVRRIEDFAFQGCTSLQKVFIPRTVDTIGRMVFDGCINLMDIDVDEENQRYLSYKGVLFDYCNCSIIRVPPKCSWVTNVNTIPAYVRNIDSGAFDSCQYLKSITISPNILNIGDFAFNDCKSLEEIKILGSINTISALCFSGCSSMKSISIPDTVTVIEDGAFWGCTSIKTMVLPKNLIMIWHSAFCECTSLQSIYIPNSVKTIYGENLGYGFAGAFYGCSALNAIHCAILKPGEIDIVEDVFEKVDLDNCNLFVPTYTLEEYRKHPVFSQFKNIIEE